jgi:hypothetical protein
MFSILFIEPAGANAVNNVTYYNPNLSQVQYGEYAHSQVRRFIVVKHKREYCFAVYVSHSLFKTHPLIIVAPFSHMETEPQQSMVLLQMNMRSPTHMVTLHN